MLALPQFSSRASSGLLASKVTNEQTVMSSQEIILNHDLWRKGAGGAPAALAGQTDASAYVGLDLDLARFTDSVFVGSRFAATTFRQAQWTACRFTDCVFDACDFSGISITGCTFVNCVFDRAEFRRSTLSGSCLMQCRLNGVNFDQGRWSEVKLLECTGTQIKALGLRGEGIDFMGSNFEHLQFEDTILNSVV